MFVPFTVIHKCFENKIWLFKIDFVHSINGTKIYSTYIFTLPVIFATISIYKKKKNHIHFSTKLFPWRLSRLLIRVFLMRFLDKFKPHIHFFHFLCKCTAVAVLNVSAGTCINVIRHGQASAMVRKEWMCVDRITSFSVSLWFASMNEAATAVLCSNKCMNMFIKNTGTVTLQGTRIFKYPKNQSTESNAGRAYMQIYNGW